MLISNSNQLPENLSVSPKGKYGCGTRDLSIALGRKPQSTDLLERQPFDVQICRIPAGKARCPFHQHTAQWEFYHVISGRGTVRHKDGSSPIGPGDAFLFRPNEPHQLISDAHEDLILTVVADNPMGESCYYPDSQKWWVADPHGPITRADPVEYMDGEE
jgi:uncharacterized cupin superfamily protein